MPHKKKIGSLITDPGQVLQRIQVLILDGSTKITELYRNIFLQLGFTNVFTANDPEEGMQILRQMRIDLVVSDWDLQAKKVESFHRADSANVSAHKGIYFVETLRRAPNSPNPFIPVIMLTEQVTGKDVMEAINAGVNEIVVKPFKAEDLCDRMVKVIDNPRFFITARSYKGPCRRRRAQPLPKNVMERRSKEIRIVKYNERRT